MSSHPTESKRLLSHTVAEWACSLKYEHLSPEAIQAAKLFWFDSIACALGGSQQEDAKILLKHYRAMSGETVAGGADPGPENNFLSCSASATWRFNSSMPRAPLPETAWKLVANTRRTPKTR